MKRARAARLAVIGARQVPVPVQYPSHVTKACPVLGVAVRVTTVPLSNATMHPVLAATPAVMTQLTPAGCDVTTPLPVPVPVTVNVFFATTAKSGAVSFS